MHSIYRDDEAALHDRRRELRASWQAAYAAAVPALSRLYADRVARTRAGQVATVGAVAMAVVAILHFGIKGFPRPNLAAGTSVPSLLLLASLLAGAIVYGVVYLAARRHLQNELAAPVETGDVRRDIAVMESTSPTTLARAAIERREQPSLLWPLIAISLLAPLSLHLCPAMAIIDRGQRLPGFSVWIAISVMLVGHSHGVLAHLAQGFVERLAESLDKGLPFSGTQEGFKALGLTTLSVIVSPLALFTLCQGGFGVALALMVVSGVLVALTGLLIVPVSFRAIFDLAKAERKYLATEAWTTAELPPLW